MTNETVKEILIKLHNQLALGNGRHIIEFVAEEGAANVADAVQVAVYKADRIGKLEQALQTLRTGDCWCECGIDNPMMRGEHSEACKTVQNILR